MIEATHELKDRIEARRKQLESALAELKADARETSREAVESIQERLSSLNEMLKEGWDNVTESTLAKLNEWLKRETG